MQQLLKETQNLPELIGTEMYQDVTTLSYGDKDGSKGKVTRRADGGKRYKLTDLTKAYRDLVSDMPMINAPEETNAVMLTYADIFSHAAPARTIEQIEAMYDESGDEDV